MINNINSINIINPPPGYKRLSKQGTVQELQLWLVNYYGEDLSTPSAPPLAVPSKEAIMHVEIDKIQWAWARQLD